MIAGVCGGLGEYTRLDPTIWRIIFVVLALPGGLPGVIPYLIMWIIVPNDISRKGRKIVENRGD